MRVYGIGLVLATALSLGAGTAQAVPCPPSAELLFSDTAAARGVVTEVAWRSEEIQQVHYYGAAGPVPVTVQKWRATIDLTTILRGEPLQAFATYDFQTPPTGCEGRAVEVGEQLLMSINPRGEATIESEATWEWMAPRVPTERPSKARNQDSENQ